jgi:hypothetical protein
MGITKKSIGIFIGSTVAALFICNSAVAETVEITYEGLGTASTLDVKNGPDITTGLFEVTIDGNTTFAATNSNDRHYLSTWSATVNTYDDVQNGAGKFNNAPDDKTKYNQAGYLFTLLDFSATLSATAAKYNALVNYVIWDIMGFEPRLNDRSDRRQAKSLKQEASKNQNFDWSSTMYVYTSNERLASRELLASVPPPIATPIPSAIFLFGSMALGLFGIATRKRINA